MVCVVVVGSMVVVVLVALVVVVAPPSQTLQDSLQYSFMYSALMEQCPSFAQLGQSELLSEHSVVSLCAGVLLVVVVGSMVVVVLVALVVVGAPPWQMLQDILQYSFMYSGLREQCPSFAQLGHSELLSEHSAA